MHTCHVAGIQQSICFVKVCKCLMAVTKLLSHSCMKEEIINQVSVKLAMCAIPGDPVTQIFQLRHSTVETMVNSFTELYIKYCWMFCNVTCVGPVGLA